MRAALHTDTADAGFWPAPRSGVWSLRLMALAALAMVSSMVAVAAGQRGGDAPADNWAVTTLLGLLGALFLIGEAPFRTSAHSANGC